MRIHIEKDESSRTLQFEGRVIDLLAHLNLNPEEVLVIRKECVLSDIDTVSNSDIITILSVVSGG